MATVLRGFSCCGIVDNINIVDNVSNVDNTKYGVNVNVDVVGYIDNSSS